MSPSNVLLLDEPTNHLDILSKDILKNALLQYKGTLIIISHDRDFLLGLSDRSLEFRNKNIKEYLGDIQYFLDKKKKEKTVQANSFKKEKEENSSSSSKKNWKVKKENDKRLRKLKKDIRISEEMIAGFEEKTKEINLKLSQPEKYSAEFKSGELFKQHEDLNNKLKDEYSKWEKLSTQIEEFE